MCGLSCVVRVCLVHLCVYESCLYLYTCRVSSLSVVCRVFDVSPIVFPPCLPRPSPSVCVVSVSVQVSCVIFVYRLPNL